MCQKLGIHSGGLVISAVQGGQAVSIHLPNQQMLNLLMLSMLHVLGTIMPIIWVMI
jgi:hypothetical protein